MVFRRPTDPRRTEAAARLARFLTLEHGQEINREAGLLPSRISALGVLADDPRYRDILTMLPEGISPPVHPAWLQVDQVISEQLQLALLRRIDVDTAVRRMQERGQMVLDDYWAARDAGK
jgi:ABC-type glycerol-3-phosphate transport system substrate-binding protein